MPPIYFEYDDLLRVISFYDIFPLRFTGEPRDRRGPQRRLHAVRVKRIYRDLILGPTGRRTCAAIIV